MRPNLFIIGGQKCGTSALAHFIAQHPEICLAQGKEAHILDHPEYLNQNGQVCVSDLVLDQAYAEKFAHAQGEQYLCDATPIYAYWNQVLPKLAEYQPNAKVIFMLRDPVERAISQYTMERKRGFESESMLKAFLKEPSRLQAAQHDYSWHSSLRTHSYLDRGHFSLQLAEIKRHFGENNVLVMHNDELRHHHQQAMQRIFDFLQIESVAIAEESVFAGQYTSLSIGDRLAKLYAKAKLHKEQKFVRQYTTKLPSKSE